jgi:hypothetical protein
MSNTSIQPTTKHTAGPWTIEEGYKAAQIVGDNAIVTVLPEWPCQADEQRANARLVATAPELLEALRRLELVAYDAEQNGVSPNLVSLRQELTLACSQARNAIAKATQA